jgi:YggT family protein
MEEVRGVVIWAVIGLVLWVYFILVWIRVLIEITRMFARHWRPVGVTAVGLEVVYVTTDVAIRPIRRLIPPVRIGTVRLDLSVLILLIAILALRALVLSLP